MAESRKSASSSMITNVRATTAVLQAPGPSSSVLATTRRRVGAPRGRTERRQTAAEPNLRALSVETVNERPYSAVGIRPRAVAAPTRGPTRSSRGRARAPCRPFSRWVSLARPPNRTCDFHRIRLSTTPHVGYHLSLQLVLDPQYPRLSYVERQLRCVGFHRRPPAIPVHVLRVRCPPWPCGRLYPASDCYEGSAASRARQSTTDLPATALAGRRGGRPRA